MPQTTETLVSPWITRWTPATVNGEYVRDRESRPESGQLNIYSPSGPEQWLERVDGTLDLNLLIGGELLQE